MKTTTRKQQIIFNIVLTLIATIVFFAGYAVSFYCTTINVDYSANHVETYENCTVKYDPEFNKFTVIDNHGNKITYGGIK
jgi:hypothetical protein